VHARTDEEMAGAIRSLLADAAEREAAGRRAEAYVREHHSPQIVAERYERLLADLVGAG
jgi:glycosyltransferase involved in cell wall biosynthesis